MATSTNKTAAFRVKLIHKSMSKHRYIHALWACGIIGPYFFKNDEGYNVTVNGDRYRAMLDYFLWGYGKSLVYVDKPQALDHLEENIHRVIADIRPQMLEKVIENLTSRLDYIRASRAVLCQKSYLKFRILTIAKKPSDDIFDKPSCFFSLCCHASLKFVILHKLANIWINKDSLCQLDFGYARKSFATQLEAKSRE
ncbi:transposable element Tc3 transposase [Trichonephila clavipes]|nr:transposable element Tc3 transposase [Trichonephila clavipes]